VWTDSRSGAAIYGARVNAAGAVLDPTGFRVSPLGANFLEGATVASGPAGSLVVWEDNSVYPAIRGMRIPTGSNAADAGVAVATVMNVGLLAPQVVFDGAQFVVAFTRPSPSFLDTDVYGVRVSPQGAVLDTTPVALATTPDPERAPALLYDGTQTLLTWSQDTAAGPRVLASAFAPGSLTADAGSRELLPGDFATAKGPGDGTGIIAYQRYDSSAPIYTERVFIRLIGALPSGASCATGDACTCIGGVCCATSCDAGTCGGGVCGMPVPDAGMPVDGGLSADGGSTDGGSTLDGGAGQDGGAGFDAGAGSDAGVAPPSARGFRVGLGCAVSDASPVVGLAVVVAMRRLRRRSK
jgi:hypothetical protein